MTADDPDVRLTPTNMTYAGDANRMVSETPVGTYVVAAYMYRLPCDTPHPADKGDGVFSYVYTTYRDGVPLGTTFIPNEAFNFATTDYVVRRRENLAYFLDNCVPYLLTLV